MLIPRLRPATGIALALYAPCVWPANINHALRDIPLGGSTSAEGITVRG